MNEKENTTENYNSEPKFKLGDEVWAVIGDSHLVFMTLKARMFFKLDGGKVYFRIKILNLKETILKTFREICDKIAENTGLDVHYTK